MRRLLLLAAMAGSVGLELAACGQRGGGETPPAPVGASDAAGSARPDASVPQPDAAPVADAAALLDAATPAPERTLFVGNSFTYVNDLPGTYAALARSAPGAGDLVVDSVAYGGYTLAQHLADAQGTGPNPRLASLLGNGDSGLATWSHVVLQEQSEIPGFDASDPTRVASIDAAVALSGLAAATGATTVLFLTWGYDGGDPNNPTLYPDYLTMQSRLEAGYRDMAHAIATSGRPVLIAPAGLAFQAVYQHDVDAGSDPAAPGSLFASLYGTDAKHPSPAGTFLTACVMVATIEGVDATTLAGTVAGLDAGTVAELEAIAQSTVVAERARPSP
jgi:hypothetical protein